MDAALVQQYMNFADNEILPPVCTWAFPTLGMMQYNKEVGFYIVYCVFFLFILFILLNEENA